MRLSLAQLQALRAVRECGSYTGAAERLGVTQPAITQHLAKLGREFGVSIADMVGHRPVLTQAGEYLAVRAETILASVDALAREMQEFTAGRTGTLEVGATVTIGTYVMPALIAEYRRGGAALAVQVPVANTAAISQMIREQRLTLALVEGLAGHGLVSVPFMRDELVCIVCAKADPLRGARQVRARDLAGVGFVSREPGSGTRDLGYEAIVRAGVRPPILLELPSGEAILRAVEAGLGAAILSRLVIARELERGSVRAVKIADVELQRSFSIVRAPHRTLSPAQRAFARIVLGGDEGVAAFEAGVTDDDAR